MFIALAAASCSRAPQRAVDSIATYPFDNQSGRPALDWMGPVLAASLETQTAGAARLHLTAAASVSAARAARPSRLLHGYYAVEGATLVVKAVLSEAATGRNLRRMEARGPLAEGPAAPAAALAREFVDTPRPFPSGNPEALRAYGEALLEAGAEDSLLRLRRALELDPDFGDAWLRLAEALATRPDPAGLMEVLEAALAPARKLDPIVRARLELMRASREAGAASRLAALEKLAGLVPAEAEPALQLADLYLVRHRIEDAVRQYRRALAARPESAAVWNQAAYAEARSGELAAARRSLAEYARLAPSNPNPSDSLGEIELMAGRFAEAEQAFLESYRMSPGFLASTTMRKAALARLLTGDVPGADALFGKYLDAAYPDPLVKLRHAQWLYVSGRRARAVEMLGAFAAEPGSAGELAATAWAQLAAWRLDQGDRRAARDAAAQARNQARGATAVSLAVVAGFVAQPETDASEWALRAEREFSDGPLSALKQHALAYALLYGKHFQEASLVLKQLYERTDPNAGDHLRELLALAYARQDRWDDAAPLLELWPVPDTTGDALFHCLVFPAGIELRARLAGRDGGSGTAAQLERVHAALRGPLPQVE